jgi:phosphatidylglycerophosphatase A
MREFFLTVGFSGKAKYAPGTVGSFVSLILGLLILNYFPSSAEYPSNYTLFMLSILVTVIAIKEIDIYQKEKGVHDPKEIVIDELAGMWLALSISGETLVAAILSFAFFRYFDITKPSIIGKIDQKYQNGIGVMFDDIIAGFFGGILSALVCKLIF